MGAGTGVGVPLLHMGVLCAYLCHLIALSLPEASPTALTGSLKRMERGGEKGVVGKGIAAGVEKGR
jgi:hypothetical protein